LGPFATASRRTPPLATPGEWQCKIDVHNDNIDNDNA